MFTALLDDGRIDDFSRSLSLDCRGTLFARAELFDKALIDLNRAIELKPDNADYWIDQGEVYRRMKKFEAAITSHTKAISLRPKSAKALTSRGYSHFELNRFSEALEDSRPLRI